MNNERHFAFSSKETHTNPEEFPASFVKGTANGIWWAFITMTTVGYVFNVKIVTEL